MSDDIMPANTHTHTQTQTWTNILYDTVSAHLTGNTNAQISTHSTVNIHTADCVYLSVE